MAVRRGRGSTSLEHPLRVLAVDHAVTRLAAGDSVAEVAEALGFSEASAFQRAFKSWTGVPPGRYQRGRTGAPGASRT